MHQLTTAAHDMFQLGLPVIEKIIRPILVYFALIVLLRIFGKRELAQVNQFDLVVLLSLSNTVQNAIIGEDNSLVGGLIGAGTLLLTNWLVVRFLFRHPKVDRMVEGDPTVLIEHGQVVEHCIREELITMSELEVIARRQGFDGIHDVESCILEPGGIFIMKQKQPTPDEKRHQTLLSKLDLLAAEVQHLRTQISARG